MIIRNSARGILRSTHYRALATDDNSVRVQRKHLPFADGRAITAIMLAEKMKVSEEDLRRRESPS